MDVFNKIKSTLTSTVSEISAALPGNPLLREYDVGEQIGSAGPGLMWKIYEGVKKTTKAEVAVWILEKKLVDHHSKIDKEVMLDVFRKGCMQLTKLRHPRVLTVQQSLEESRDSLCFCTEPTFASLANILGQRLNISDPTRELMSYNLHEIEIKYGLMQLAEALAFLHEKAKMIHGNVCPESVILSKSGAWKIAGFDFCVFNSGSGTNISYQCRDWDSSLPSISLPNPNYLAPEYILRKSCDTSSDLFSLGVLLYSIYYNGKTLLHCTSSDIYKAISRNVDKLEHINSQSLEKIPEEVREHEKMLINPNPEVRPDAEQMSKLPFFNHVGVRTLQYLDSLLQRDNLQKSQFFKGLPKIIPQLPKRVLLQRVLPCLTSEFANPDMVPFVLPSVMIIADTCNEKEFAKVVFPTLIPVFKLQKPVQVLLILLQNMELLLKKTPSSMIQNHILPMLSAALGSSSIQIQELCMSIVPNFADRLDLQSLKTSILPKIRHIAIEGGTISIRIHALVCVGKLVSSFDKWFVQDEVLPFLEKIACKEPGVLMGILGIYKTVLTSDKIGISKHVMATKALPFLIPLSIENTLNLKQYTAFMAVIKEMMQRVEIEHCDKLEQLSKMQIEQDAALDFQNTESPISKPTAASSASVDDIFNKASDKSEPVATRQHLTLEEKQRLARLKESQYRMKKEGELKPVNVAQPVQKPTTVSNKPKDLTSTLMQNNLSAMSLSTPPQNVRPPPFQTQSINFGVPTNQNFSFATAPPSTTQWPRMTSSFGSSNISTLASTPQLSSNSTGLNLHNNMAQMNSTRMSQPRTNTSSLDSLMRMPSQHGNIPMNQMRSVSVGQTPQPFMPHAMAASAAPAARFNHRMVPQKPSNGIGNVSTTNQLSKDDLLDFLG